MQVNTYPYLHMDLTSIFLSSIVYFDLFIVCWLNPSLLYFGIFVIFHPRQKEHDRSLYHHSLASPNSSLVCCGVSHLPARGLLTIIISIR